MDINKQSSSSTNYEEEIKDMLSKEKNYTNPISRENEILRYMLNITNDISEYRNRISNLEDQKTPEKRYFKAARLNIQISNLVFLILPVLQLFVTVYAISHFSLIESGYIETYKGILTFIGIGVVFEIFYVPFQIEKLKNRLDELE